MKNWQHINGYSVRFVLTYQGVEDYEVYSRDDNSETRLSWDHAKREWRGFCGELDANKLAAIKVFVADRNKEDLEFLTARGLDIPDSLRSDPRTV